MVELAKLFATHIEDDFVIPPENILFITGMSNVLWQNEMTYSIPNCFRDNVYHHGRLRKLQNRLHNSTNMVIIVDEIDTGDKEDQCLHNVLRDSGVLNIHYMEEHNIRFVFISATISENQKDLFRWGERHATYRLTVPANYIGHNDLLERGILQEFYKVDSEETALKWVKEDIIDYYGPQDVRVNIIRTSEKCRRYIESACIQYDVEFHNHTSTDRISEEELESLFNSVRNYNKHCVIAVKGFYRRANLIPNAWKMLIGATHERCVNAPNENVQVQGLPGRMTGYWKDVIDGGHKTGPHRTSLAAIRKYEEWCENPWIVFNHSEETTRRITNPVLSNQATDATIERNLNQNSNKRPPVILPIQPEITRQLTGHTLTANEKQTLIISELEKMPNTARLVEFIRRPDVRRKQITAPTTVASRKKHILDIVEKQNQACTVDLSREDKTCNNWQAFIDRIEHRVCIVIWSLNKTWSLAEITY
jgi:hypothetical protein